MESTEFPSSSHLSDDEVGPILSENSRCSIPGYLKKVLMEEEVGVPADDLTLLVVAIHAVFRQSGFTIIGGRDGGYWLPEGWASKTSPFLMLSYVISEVVDLSKEAIVCVKVSCTGKFANVCGLLIGNKDVYRVCFDASRFASSLATASSMGEISKEDENMVFELWRMLKGGLCLPLLMDISDKYDLTLLSCFTRLPKDVMIMILELLPGHDLARIGCVSSDMRYLSSDDELWKKRVVKEFGFTDGKNLYGKRWKDKFKNKAEMGDKVECFSTSPRPVFSLRKPHCPVWRWLYD